MTKRKEAKREPGERAINGLLRERNKLRNDLKALSVSRDALMGSLSELSRRQSEILRDHALELRVERNGVQATMDILRNQNRKILETARKVAASPVLILPGQLHTKADETELKCHIGIIEAWAQEQEFKLVGETIVHEMKVFPIYKDDLIDALKELMKTGTVFFK